MRSLTLFKFGATAVMASCVALYSATACSAQRATGVSARFSDDTPTSPVLESPDVTPQQNGSLGNGAAPVTTGDATHNGCGCDGSHAGSGVVYVDGGHGGFIQGRIGQGRLAQPLSGRGAGAVRGRLSSNLAGGDCGCGDAHWHDGHVHGAGCGCDDGRTTLRSRVRLESPLERGSATGISLFTRGTHCNSQCGSCDDCRGGLLSNAGSRIGNGQLRSGVAARVSGVGSRLRSIGDGGAVGYCDGCSSGGWNQGWHGAGDCGCDDGGRLGLGLRDGGVRGNGGLLGGGLLGGGGLFSGGLIGQHAHRGDGGLLGRGGVGSHGGQSGLLAGGFGSGRFASGFGDECGACRGLGGHRGCHACGLTAGRGQIPHTEQPPFGADPNGAGMQAPTYAYPYYTARAPRDFLMDNPPSIGW